MEKTPVTYLNDLGSSIKVIPVYEFLTDGCTEKNGFSCKVTFMDWQAIGSSSTKKDAKQAAAKKILEKFANNNMMVFSTNSSPDLPAKTSKEIIPADRLVNPVGYLQEFCTQLKIRCPEYELLNDIGPPHAKEFTIQCSLAGYKEQASATTKKWAKHYAAREMIIRMQEQGGLNDSGFKEIIDTCDNSDSNNSIEINLIEKETAAIVDNVQRKFVFEKLGDLLKLINTEGENACDQLVDTITKTFSEILSDIKVKNRTLLGNFDGMYIISMYVSTIPHIVVADAGKNSANLLINIHRKAIGELIQNLTADP